MQVPYTQLWGSLSPTQTLHKSTTVTDQPPTSTLCPIGGCLYVISPSSLPETRVTLNLQDLQ